MAHLSEDPGLLDAFARGEDIHRATAAEIFGRSPPDVTADQRRYAKTINFGLIYGMSAFGLAQQLGIERATAQAVTSTSYFARYPGVRTYMETHPRSSRASRAMWRRCSGGGCGSPEIRSSNQARARRRRAGGDQRADAGHRGRPHQARDDRGAGLARAR